MSDMNRNVLWTLEEDEVLIDFVKNHECLYNVKCKEYRMAQLKLNLWREIANILETKTVIQCSKRWAYVRDYYVRRREKPGTGAPGEVAKKRAEQLSFLDSCSAMKRSTITNIANCEQYTGDADVMQEDSNEDAENFTKEKYGSQNEAQTKRVNNDNEGEMTREKSKSSKKVKHLSNSEERLKMLKDIVGRCNKSEEKDETDLFFASMAKIVKKLPETEQVYIRLQIGTMVGNAQLRHLQEKESCSRPSSVDSYAGSNFNIHENEGPSTSSTQQHAVSENNTLPSQVASEHQTYYNL